MKKIFTVLVVSLFTVFSAMAQLPYNTTMTSDHYNDATIVKSDGDNGWDGGIRLGDVNGGGFNYSDKYVVIALSENGIAKKITCTTEAKSISFITPPTEIVFYIAWSADNSSFTTLETKKSKTNSFDVELPKEAKYIKLCYSGNFGGYFRDIVVEELVYCNAPEHDVWEPTDTIGAEPTLGETTMEWCNTEAFTVTLSGEGASQFTSSITNNASKGQYGTATISATYKHDVAGVHEAVLTVDNGTYSYTIALKGTTLAADPEQVAQEITWEQDLAVVNVFDTVVLDAVAMTEVTYTVSDSTVASVDGNVLVLHNAGEVVVYAYAAESDEYLADTVAKTVVVAPLMQEIVWTMDTLMMTVGDTMELNAVATSGLEVVYYLSCGDVVTLDDKLLIALQPGEVVVTAAQDGTNNYLAAEAVEYTITVVDLQTGTENVNSDAKARAYKVVRDGRIYIHMGGNVYDMLGTQL
jgi:hypothetical protein